MDYAGGRAMKITAELVNRRGFERQYMDIDIKIDADEAERTLLATFHVPIATSTDGGGSQELLRSCYACQGDLYREVGVRNFRTFQPDWTYFNSSSSGWSKFVNKVSTEEDRDEILQRIAQAIGAKIKMLVKRASPVSYILDIQTPGPAEVPVRFEDLAGRTLDIRVGNKLFRCTKVIENATGSKLVESTLAELKEQAAAKLGSYQVECAHNIELMKKQYEKQINDLNVKFEKSVIAPAIPQKLLLEGIMYAPDHDHKRHSFYVPIKLEYKYMAMHKARWELKKKYQLSQEGYLYIQTDSQLNVVYGMIYDNKLGDTIQLWHNSGGVCWGSYTPKLTKVEDLIKLRDDVATMLGTINLSSVGARNLRGNQQELYTYTRGSGSGNLPLLKELESLDYSEVANLVGDKRKGKESGKDELWLT
jgi:hypothetical protein